jgi:hypothetical protein
MTLLFFPVYIECHPRPFTLSLEGLFPFSTLPLDPSSQRFDILMFRRADVPYPPKSFTAHASEISRRSDLATCGGPDLSPLECSVADKHRVLPVFSRNRPASSPLEATLMSILVSVASKWFTGKLSSLECALTKKQGGGGRGAAFLDVRTFRPSDVWTFKRSASPIAADGPWCNNGQRRENSSRSGETTPLPPVSNDNKRTSGTARRRSRLQLQVVPGSTVLRRVSGFVLTNLEQAGFRVCTYKP